MCLEICPYEYSTYNLLNDFRASPMLTGQVPGPGVALGPAGKGDHYNTALWYLSPVFAEAYKTAVGGVKKTRRDGIQLHCKG